MNFSLPLILLVSFILNWDSLNSQQIYIQGKTGETSDYNLKDVRKVFFSGDTMNLQLKDGSTYFWNVSALRNYRYVENALGTAELLDAANEWNLNIFPNPAEDILNVKYHLAGVDEIYFALYGMDGKIIRKEFLGKLPSGEQLHTLSLQNLPLGIYLIRLSGEKSGITKTLIKN